MKYRLLISLTYFLSVTAFSQTKQTFKSVSGSLCSKTIILYPDAGYFFESSCEALSQVAFGKWAVKKDTLTLTPVDPKTYQVIKNIQANRAPGDSIWVTIFDKDGINMTDKISIGLEVSGRGSYMFSADSTGAKKFVYKRAGGKIVLRTLNKLFSQQFALSTDTANHFVINLNIRAASITSTHSDWSGFGAVKLVKKGATLVSRSSQAGEGIIFKQTN